MEEGAGWVRAGGHTRYLGSAGAPQGWLTDPLRDLRLRQGEPSDVPLAYQEALTSTLPLERTNLQVPLRYPLLYDFQRRARRCCRLRPAPERAAMAPRASRRMPSRPAARQSPSPGAERPRRFCPHQAAPPFSAFLGGSGHFHLPWIPSEQAPAFL